MKGRRAPSVQWEAAVARLRQFCCPWLDRAGKSGNADSKQKPRSSADDGHSVRMGETGACGYCARRIPLPWQMTLVEAPAKPLRQGRESGGS